MKLGVEVHGFDPQSISDGALRALRESIYVDKLVILKGQRLSPRDFVALGRRLGTPEAYYEPMYRHPEENEIFVSGNVAASSGPVGVPKTGQFWHADYQFMPRPFGITLIHPRILPRHNRGTYFIDMGQAHGRLPAELRRAVVGTRCLHTVRNYFKIRPSDVYRPVIEVLREIDERTPVVRHPTTFIHPVTGETVLYLSEGFTIGIEDGSGAALDEDLLRALLAESGQLDHTFEHEGIHWQTYDDDDLIMWDNRSLVHRAVHTSTPEPAVSHRVTVHDDHPFYAADTLAPATDRAPVAAARVAAGRD
ncbi:taurine catabolism dioxygenase [Pseudofrankia asymbiotica]|uniref:Taurine catabolism dioxygenase n=1 Tax=Pseudofrankia asymbiotica TaxID=1834516 RepID=A0A1V2IE44_9ACTN|nr:taurine catabolism dioxygenase [Pseudofrankia asymbiotica]